MAGEEGIALTVAILSLALMVTLGGVALTQAMSALRQSSTQEHVKRALGAADAGIEAAAVAASAASLGSGLDIDPLDPAASLAQNCVVTLNGDVNGVPLAVPALDIRELDALTQVGSNGRRWCPTSGSESVTSASSFEYRLSELLHAGGGDCGNTNLLTLDREVVAVGRSGTETRRVKATLEANLAILSGAAVQSLNDLTMSSSARILGDARSNGNITGALTNTISGNAVRGHGTPEPGVGVGPTVLGSKAAACENFTIPDVDQGDAPIDGVNDNSTLVGAEACVSVSTGLTLASCVILGVRTGRVTYDPVKRTLLVEGNGRALLTGDTYSFCSVTVRGNGILQISSGTPVTRIFLDDPANCPGVSGAGSINVTEQARIVNCHPQTMPESLQLYAVGNPSIPTTQTLGGNSLPTTTLRGTLCGLSLGAILGEPMTVIAPRSTVSLSGGFAMSGQVAAQQVSMANDASVNPVNALINLEKFGGRPILPLYRAVDYVECTGVGFGELPAAEPAQGC
jgi:hypothetical protein